MKKLRLIFLSVSLILVLVSADKPAYHLFTSDGKMTDYDQMLKAVREADIVFFGELHNNPVVHWLEFELTSDLYNEKKQKLILGAEMFEADDQLKLNEYLAGTITEKNFEDEIKKWPNYRTDYKPLVKFAKDNKLVFTATNIPRRYAAYVSAHGMDSLRYLSDEAKNLMAPLPVKYDPDLSCYKNISSMTMGHKSSHLAEAQAIKDATMAYFILKNYTKGSLFLHFNGAYHSNNGEGIIWYLKNSAKNLKIVTISSVEQKEISSLDNENKNLADFIIAVNENMTKTN